MKIQVISTEGKALHEIDLPEVFDSAYRPDLIKRAVLAQQSLRYQPHGTDPWAGLRTSAESWGSGRGAAQVPRIKNGRRTARIPQATGGRAAHPPKVEKILVEKVNRKEKRKAVASAIAATNDDAIVSARGHRFSCALPVVFEDGFESLGTTKEVLAALQAAGLGDDIERSKNSRKVRAGRGKMRGRRYKQRKSVLIVTGDKQLLPARNLAGVDTVSVDRLNAELLAPGTQAGRLTVWTESAIKKLEGF
jgi:large subunit ribosomal protein L4e